MLLLRVAIAHLLLPIDALIANQWGAAGLFIDQCRNGDVGDLVNTSDQSDNVNKTRCRDLALGKSVTSGGSRPSQTSPRD